MAVRDCGLKPWEFEAMTMQQYVDYAEGVRIREAKLQEPHRLVFWRLTALTSSKKVSYSEIVRDWPLYIDKKAESEVKDMSTRWNNLEQLQRAVNEPGRV